MKCQALKELDKISLWKSRFVRRLKQNCNGEAAFCGCYIPPLIGRWGCFRCSFLGVHALLPQLKIHSCFARILSKQQANWPCLNLSQAKSNLGTQLPECWWEKGFLCMFFLCSSPFQNCDKNIILGKETHPWFLPFTENGSKAKHLLLSREKIIE